MKKLFVHRVDHPRSQLDVYNCFGDYNFWVPMTYGILSENEDVVLQAEELSALLTYWWCFSIHQLKVKF